MKSVREKKKGEKEGESRFFRKDGVAGVHHWTGNRQQLHRSIEKIFANVFIWNMHKRKKNFERQ